MSPVIQEHLISAANTFLTTFVVSLGATLSSGGIEWTFAFWSAVAVAAVRAAAKEVLARNLPVKLGGRK